MRCDCSFMCCWLQGCSDLRPHYSQWYLLPSQATGCTGPAIWWGQCFYVISSVTIRLPSNLWYKTCLNWQWNCWSLRCSWSIACRRCSNYTFILNLTHGFNIMNKGNCNTRRHAFKFWDLMRRILEIWRYVLCPPPKWITVSFTYQSNTVPLYSGFIYITILYGISFMSTGAVVVHAIVFSMNGIKMWYFMYQGRNGIPKSIPCRSEGWTTMQVLQSGSWESIVPSDKHLSPNSI